MFSHLTATHQNVIQPMYPRELLRPSTSLTGVGITQYQSVAFLGVGGFGTGFFIRQVCQLNEALFQNNPYRGVFTGVTGVSIRRSDNSTLIEGALRNDNFNRTIITRSTEEESARIASAITGYVSAVNDLPAAIKVIASPQTRILAMTLTEGGYCCNKGDNYSLDLNNKDVQHDLELLKGGKTGSPKTVYGYLALGLEERQKIEGSAPLYLLSCDNLPANGDILFKALKAFLKEANSGLADKLGEIVRAPISMVDQIVPEFNPKKNPHDQQTYDYLLRKFGPGIGALPVVKEPFFEYVIESGTGLEDILPLDMVGARFVSRNAVMKHTEKKLWLLNGAHSLSAYGGLLRGHTTIDGAVNDQLVQGALKGLWNETIPLLDQTQGINYSQYTDQLQIRFTNPHMGYTTKKVGMGGTGKMPDRIFGQTRLALEGGASIDYFALTTALWHRALINYGADILHEDTHSYRKAHESALISSASPASFIMSQPDIFGSLTESEVFINRFAKLSIGVRDSLEQTLMTPYLIQ